MEMVAPIPLDDAQRLAWLRLSRSRNVGARSFRSLVNRYGDVAKALDALPDLATRGGARAYQACSLKQGEGEMERAAAAGARMLRLGAPDYPERLAEIIDPPLFLWCRGDPGLAEGVGSGSDRCAECVILGSALCADTGRGSGREWSCDRVRPGQRDRCCCT